MTPGARPATERPRPAGLPLLRADERFVEQLAATIADQVALRLQAQAGEDEGYLNPEAAGRHICASRRRIHELTSTGLLVPDGHDGRTPLYRRQTLDRYVGGEGAADENRLGPVNVLADNANGAAPRKRPAPGP